MCWLLVLLEPAGDVRAVHLYAALVEYPTFILMHLVSLKLLLWRFHFLLLLSFMLLTLPRKVFLVEALDKKLELFLILFLEVRERVLAPFEDVIQCFQLVVLTFRGRVGCLMVLAACERMLLRLLPIRSLNHFGLLLYGRSWYRWVRVGRCKEREVLWPIKMPLFIIDTGLILLRTALF